MGENSSMHPSSAESVLPDSIQAYLPLISWSICRKSLFLYFFFTNFDQINSISSIIYSCKHKKHVRFLPHVLILYVYKCHFHKKQLYYTIFLTKALELASSCCFLYANCNSNCSADHWVIAHTSYTLLYEA